MKRILQYLLPSSSSSTTSSSSSTTSSSSSPSSSSSRVTHHTPEPNDDSDHYYTPRCNGTHRHLLRLQTQKTGERNTISILSYNILANMLATPALAYCSLDTVKWESRQCVLMKEIIHYNADVLCLLETQSDHIHNFWVPELGKHGYHHIHAVKKFSRHLSVEYYKTYRSDGCSIFYKRSKMQLVHSYKHNLGKTGGLLCKKFSASFTDKLNLSKDNLAIAGVFELQGSGIRFCVCTCHIFPNPEMPDVKVMQVSEIVRGLKRLNKLKFPIILCGDFNTTPNEPLYRYLVNGHLDWFPQLDDPSKVYQHLDLIHDLELSSAYPALLEYDTDDDEVLKQRTLMNQITHEPIFTTSVPSRTLMNGKVIPAFIDTIDYIFYQKRYMTVAALLELVDLKAGEYLPSEIYPSDHIALMAEFTFVPEHLSSEKWLDLPDYIWGPLAERESD